MNKRSEIWITPPASFAETALKARLSKLLEEVNRCATKPGIDEVHDLRVSIRRFSQALRIFSPMLDGKPARRMRKALRPVLEAAAAVRDLDVGAERLLEEGLDEGHPLLAEMRTERQRQEMGLRGRLLLLKSGQPEQSWPADLRVHASKKSKRAQAAQTSGAR